LITEEVSINTDRGVDTGALLSGDADEELRMQDRLSEKSANARNGKMARVTAADIRESQREPREPIKREESKLLLVNED
jgi:hypothetical protein